MDRLSLFNTFKWVCDKVLTDYKWLIAIFFVLRLYGITDPPLEIQHNWRQCTGLMIARNFLTLDANILYPRIDDMCQKSDIIASEFPLMSYMHYLVALLFGYAHWYGRIINLIVSSLGILSFGMILHHFFGKKLTWYSVLALLVSPWLIYSRKMMPDTHSVSLMFIGLLFGLKYYQFHKWYYLVLFFTFSTLGSLVKIPAALYFTIFLFGFISMRKKIKLEYFIATAISICIIYVWYFIWGTYISHKYGNWYNLGLPLYQGILDILSHPKEILYNIVFNSFNSYILFSLFIWGVYKIIKERDKNIILCVSLLFGIFFLYIFKAGFFFYHHNYYMIPIIPVLAFVIGYGLYNSVHKITTIIFFIGIMESIANQQHDFRIKPSELYKLELESKLDSIEKGGPKSPILINTQSNPQQIYLANRKGCYITITEMADINKINSFKSLGYRWLVIDKTYGYSSLNLSIIYADNNYIIYRL
jgi:hypothetical protein